MAELLAKQILRKIGEAYELYYRLILMIGPEGSGKTAALQEVAAVTSAPLINVNLELSRRMLSLTERQRALQLSRLLGEIVSEAEGAKVLLDNSESLFDVYLQKNPLCWLQELAGTPRSGRVGTTPSWMSCWTTFVPRKGEVCRRRAPL